MTVQAGTNGATEAEAAVNQFYLRANNLSEGLTHACTAAGAYPQMIAIAASLMISHALIEIAAHDRDGAKRLVNELAEGLVEFSAKLEGAAAQ